MSYIAKAFVKCKSNSEYLSAELEEMGYTLQYRPKNKECEVYICFNGETKTYSFFRGILE